MMAVGALVALRDAGLRAPQDISVVGYDDVPLTRDLLPALTTVHLPLEEIGEQGMRLLLSTATEPVRIPATLLARDSSGPIRSF
jgi:LacI family transcriptional regulator